MRSYGFIPEFIGRFPTVTVLHELSPGDLQKVLTETEGSIVRRQQALFDLHGIELAFEEEAIAAICERASDLGTGARGLVREVLRCLDPVDWRLPELAADGVTRVAVTRDVVQDGKEPKLDRNEALNGTRETRAEQLRQNALQPRTAIDGSEFRVQKGFTDARKLSERQLREAIERTRDKLEWKNTTGSARKWWLKFEEEQEELDRLPLVLRLLEELRKRKATITELFLASVYSDTDNVQAILHYLDYRKAKAKFEEKRKSAAEAARRGRLEDEEDDEIED